MTVVAAGGFVDISPARAETVDVVVDSAEVQLQTGEGTAKTAKVTLSNIGGALVNVAADIDGDDGCTITSDPTSIQSGVRSEVTLRFGAGCNLEKGADVRLMFGATVRPPSHIVEVGPPTETKPNWDILVYAFLIGLATGLAATLYVAARMVAHNIRRKAREPRLAWGTALEYLGTDWSFKDNWVGNVTVGSAALVALLATSDVLKAVLGAEPEAALGLLAVAGALAALFVAVGPLLLKVIGNDVAVPTIGGMLVAGLVTLVGTLGQITALTWQGAELTSGRVKSGVIVLGAALAVLVWLYAARALWHYADSGSTKPREKVSEAVAAAKIVAKAIRATVPSTRAEGRSEVTRESAVPDAEAATVQVASERFNVLL